MKLDTCLKIGKYCGLKTLGEAYLNIKMHCISIFSYDEMKEQMNELINEFNIAIEKWGFNVDSNIDDVLNYYNKENKNERRRIKKTN